MLCGESQTRARLQSKSATRLARDILGERIECVRKCGMVDAHCDDGAGFGGADHGRRQIEAQEMYGGGFFVGAARQVFVCNCKHTLGSADSHPNPVFDPDQLGKRGAAFGDVFVFDQKRRLPVGAVGNQRIVCGDFFFDAGGFEDSLRAQHFLHLVLHRHEVFEDQRCVWAECDPPRLFVRDDFSRESVRVVLHMPRG